MCKWHIFLYKRFIVRVNFIESKNSQIVYEKNKEHTEKEKLPNNPRNNLTSEENDSNQKAKSKIKEKVAEKNAKKPNLSAKIAPTDIPIEAVGFEVEIKDNFGISKVRQEKNVKFLQVSVFYGIHYFKYNKGHIVHYMFEARKISIPHQIIYSDSDLFSQSLTQLLPLAFKDNGVFAKVG